MLNSSSRTAVKAANKQLVTPPRSEGLSAALGCHAEHIRFAQCKLREGSGARGTEMLRCAQHDSQDSGQGSPSNVTLSAAKGLSQEKSYLQRSTFFPHALTIPL